MLRSFLGLREGELVSNSTLTNTEVDDRSCISNCIVGSDG